MSEEQPEVKIKAVLVRHSRESLTVELVRASHSVKLLWDYAAAGDGSEERALIACEVLRREERMRKMEALLIQLKVPIPD